MMTVQRALLFKLRGWGPISVKKSKSKSMRARAWKLMLGCISCMGSIQLDALIQIRCFSFIELLMEGQQINTLLHHSTRQEDLPRSLSCLFMFCPRFPLVSISHFTLFIHFFSSKFNLCPTLQHICLFMLFPVVSGSTLSVVCPSVPPSFIKVRSEYSIDNKRYAPFCKSLLTSLSLSLSLYRSLPLSGK